MTIKLSFEQACVVEYAAKNPGTHMLVHGRAGVGKSVVRDKIVEVCRGTKSIILGPTGMSINSKMPTPFVYTCARFLKATPSSIKSVTKLASNGLLLADTLLRKSHLLLEEAGMISPTEFCALDLALQGVLKNTLPFGGLRLIIFCDVLQLKPVEGMYQDALLFEAKRCRCKS